MPKKIADDLVVVESPHYLDTKHEFVRYLKKIGIQLEDTLDDGICSDLVEAKRKINNDDQDEDNIDANYEYFNEQVKKLKKIENNFYDSNYHYAEAIPFDEIRNLMKWLLLARNHFLFDKIRNCFQTYKNNPLVDTENNINTENVDIALHSIQFITRFYHDLPSRLKRKLKAEYTDFKFIELENLVMTLIHLNLKLNYLNEHFLTDILTKLKLEPNPLIDKNIEILKKKLSLNKHELSIVEKNSLTKCLLDKKVLSKMLVEFHETDEEMKALKSYLQKTYRRKFNFPHFFEEKRYVITEQIEPEKMLNFLKVKEAP